MCQESSIALDLSKESDSGELFEVLENGRNRDLRKYYEAHGLGYLEPGGKDPIAVYLFDLSRSQIALVLIVSLIITLVPALFCFFEGTFLTPSLEPGLQPDGTYAPQAAVIHPYFARDYGYFANIAAVVASLLMVTMYFSEFPKTLIKLCHAKVFNLDRVQWNKFITESNSKFKTCHLTIVPYLSACIITLFLSYIFVFTKNNSWSQLSFDPERRIAGLSIIPALVIMYYLISLLISRVMLVYLVLKDLFKYNPIIQPLHPDNCGGLYALGKLSMKLSYGVSVFGIVSFTGIYANVNLHKFILWHPLNCLIVAGYLIGSAILFFFPLLPAHEAMRKSKNLTLQKINNRHIHIINRIVNLVGDGTKPLNQEQLEEIDSLKRIHDTASKMPVYPFNLKTISSYLGSVMTPALIFLIQSIITFWLTRIPYDK